MAAKNNATCSICGRPYHMCASCKDSMQVNPWKMFTDTSEHYKVFQVVKGFNTGVYTKDEAKIKFKNIDLSDKDSFRPHIKQIIDDILFEPVVEKVVTPKKRNKVNKIEAEAIDDVKINEIEVVEVVEAE